MHKPRLNALPTPKFAIGDHVFIVRIGRDVALHPCPDCRGTKTWTVTTKSGAEMLCDCLRCGNYLGRDIPPLTYTKYTAHVEERTIGSIRIDTGDTYSEDYVSYMCAETGIGSGTVYYESKLHVTREDAQLTGDAEAAASQKGEDETPTALQVKHLSTLSLKDAVLDRCKSTISESWWRARYIVEDLSGLIEDSQTLKEDDKAALEEIISDDKRRAGDHPMEKIIAALRAGDIDQALANIPGEVATR